MREQLICASVIDYLSSLGYDIYKEVRPKLGGPRADIVAVRGKIIIVVEAKYKPCLKVIEQAYGWIRYSNMTFIATGFRCSEIMEKFCKSLGIGALISYNILRDEYKTEQIIIPAIRRRREMLLEKTIVPEMKTMGISGARSSNYYTPFKNTVKMLESFVASNPGCNLKQAIDGIKHHYGSNHAARISLAAWIRNKVIDTIIVKDKCLYLNDGALDNSSRD